MKNQYILIVGCTGVGKSSVADFLHQYFRNSAYYSDPYIDNPFIANAYSTTDNKSFQSEIFFIKEFLKIHKSINNIKDKWVFQERSIFECVHIFCRLFLHQQKIDQDEYNLCVDLLDELSENLRTPDAIIYLRADPSIIKERIITRSREFEKTINLDFIQLQQSLYEQWIEHFVKNNCSSIIEIDNSMNNIAATNEETLLKIKNL